MGNGEILILGIGTAGSRAAYYLYQRGELSCARIHAVDSDEGQLETLPTLHTILVPPPPSLPVGIAAEQAKQAFLAALEEPLADAKMLVVVTCLGGNTGDFYTQFALEAARSKEIPTFTFAALPHAFDSEEYRNCATQTLEILKAQHFFVITLDCAQFGQFFPDSSKENAYAQAVRWVAETTIGYMKLFAQPKIDTEKRAAMHSKSKVMNFDEMPRGIFAGTYPTIIDNQNLDIPTYLRLNLAINEKQL
ncbi:MAG: hypothetical protein MJ106_01080 [Lentisphaeria bacterium]|nr:hypothetical protein [Lentisphaeria bacterium]